MDTLQPTESLARSTSRQSRRALLRQAYKASAVAAVATGAFAPMPDMMPPGSADTRPSVVASAMGNPQTESADTLLTVALVHGAFADGASWSSVVARLQALDVAVIALANPLRGLTHDATYIASKVNEIPGPVLLVGHSYGGAVISNAAPNARNVAGLVYVSAVIPDEGESAQAIADKATDSLLGPALRSADYPADPGDKPAMELIVDPASFHKVFAWDLPVKTSTVLAASQRPASQGCFSEASGPVGWKTLPSWAEVSPRDWTIGPATESFMAKRAGATIVEADASHLVMISQPEVIADLILTAAKAVA
jgi:pimeloyl-ACP methyl ester carboxylesterase